ncbi:molybdate ABC transporter substrate-binding protein [Clostridium sp. Sa3CUN1]|uniref:Molybdate ABC transporter substrate-binding protein n=1 Tax=Clostridium gallinarum TaxID=2762246 RepID=A0ABR8Q3X9_9CLOT|nr:molybdate ABC transporter substrate-binding protein [Clostridium gallinarum]MBD7915039.1 molybdate ABC transporter substrate-binding protein [Clostridium gallinarum]
MKKKYSLILFISLLVFILSGCTNNKSSKNEGNNEVEEVTITLAAAASLKNCIDDKLISMFNEKYPNIKIQTTYDSSGKLQSQIEEGAEVDVFMSAALKQMNDLNEKGLIEDGSIVELLENKIVLIVPKESNKEIKTFEDIIKSDKIAIGDPASVPAGQYAKELFENLKIWDKVSEKLSLGTNVTEVLNWVAEASADAGVVYSTDASSNEKVKVVAEAEEGSVSKVIYPVGVIKNSANKEAAQTFIDFLKSDEAIKVFETYGFSKNK